MSATAELTAASVSAWLRRLGVPTVAASDRNREGIRVTGSGSVRVSADLDNEAHARRAADELGPLLASRYTCERRGNAFVLTGRVAA